MSEPLAKKPEYSYEELLACGRGELFGTGNAQLPLPPMLMFDRITSIGEDGGAYGKGHVRAELDVRPDLLVLRLPLSRAIPSCPAAWASDALWQLCGYLPRLVGIAGPRPGARRRRGEVLRPGLAEREQGGSTASTSSASSARSSSSASPTASSRRTDGASTRPRICAWACSRRTRPAAEAGPVAREPRTGPKGGISR